MLRCNSILLLGCHCAANKYKKLPRRNITISSIDRAIQRYYISRVPDSHPLSAPGWSPGTHKWHQRACISGGARFRQIDRMDKCSFGRRSRTTSMYGIQVQLATRQSLSETQTRDFLHPKNSTDIVVIHNSNLTLYDSSSKATRPPTENHCPHTLC